MGRIGLLLLSMCFAMQAMAAGEATVGGTKVYYNAYMSDFLSPEIAAKYKLERSKQLGGLNINLDTAGKKVASTVKGTVRVEGEKKARPLNFKQVIDDKGAIDYFAQFPVNQPATFIFDIELKVNGETKSIDYSQEVAPL